MVCEINVYLSQLYLNGKHLIKKINDCNEAVFSLVYFWYWKVSILIISTVL